MMTFCKKPIIRKRKLIKHWRLTPFGRDILNYFCKKRKTRRKCKSSKKTTVQRHIKYYRRSCFHALFITVAKETNNFQIQSPNRYWLTSMIEYIILNRVCVLPLGFQYSFDFEFEIRICIWIFHVSIIYANSTVRNIF